MKSYLTIHNPRILIKERKNSLTLTKEWNFTLLGETGGLLGDSWFPGTWRRFCTSNKYPFLAYLLLGLLWISPSIFDFLINFRFSLAFCLSITWISLLVLALESFIQILFHVLDTILIEQRSCGPRKDNILDTILQWLLLSPRSANISTVSLPV